MLWICISFDYELFLGKNNKSYEEILFKPSEKLSGVLCDNGVSGTFFADVCSVWAHQKSGMIGYSEQFSSQLKSFISNGNDVQLHIHSNWLKTDISTGIVSKDCYRIHDLGFDNDATSAPNVIINGKKYLEDVCKEIDKNYSCIAYRAGGFCTQPSEKLLEALYNAGIKIDSSVVPHLVSKNTVNSFDYSNTPKKDNWWIDNDICGESSPNNQLLFEIPLITTRPHLTIILKLGKHRLSLPYHQPKGEYVQTNSNQVNTQKSFFMRQFNRLTDYRTLSFDCHHADFIYEEIVHKVKRHDYENKDSFLCLLCHPKLATDDRIVNMDRFIKKIKKSDYPIKLASIIEMYNYLLRKGEIK